MSENNQSNSKEFKRGGARKNAGRKKGTASVKTREVADRAASEGITPLEVMLHAMREAYDANDLVVASRHAKDAAPYIHPRLANVSVEATGEMSFTITTGVPKKDE